MISQVDRVHGGVGGLDARARSLLAAAPRVIDFSVNLNPYGPPQAVLEATRNAALDVYPDPHARAARQAWANALGTSLDRIAVAHGAADLFWAIARALVSPGARVVIAEPTFSEFRIAAQAAGAVIDPVWAREADDFRHSLESLRERSRGARALYLCTPNNPTGAHLGATEVAALARALPDTCVVLDQSFLALSEHAEEAALRLPDNVLCVRSLTKEFALAGLRIGLVVGARELIAKLEAMRPTWSTSAPAQAAIAEAARQHAFVLDSYRRLRADRGQIRCALEASGLSPLPTSTVFQLVRVGEGAQFREQLMTRGVLVRDCASFGLPAYVRIGARPAEDIHLLRAALALL